MVSLIDHHDEPWQVLLNYRVALAAQCIVDPAKRPTEARHGHALSHWGSVGDNHPWWKLKFICDVQ